ncbi:Mss4-like protein [Trichoderma velutinum]
MDARCQCGSVRFKTPLPEPLALYICHCSSCRKQTGSAFGTSAIFPHFRLPDTEDLSCYAYVLPQGGKSSLIFYSYFCRSCGTRLIHMTPSKNVLSVKGGCIEGLDWTKAIHIWTKSAMVPIPEGSEAHSEASSSPEFSQSQELLD